MKAEKWKAGDFIQLGNEARREILAVVGKVVIPSISNDFTSSAGPAYLQSELERKGWELVSETTLADEYPDGEMVLVRDDTEDIWNAWFSCGRTLRGRLVCRVSKDSTGRTGSSWVHVRKFDENLIGTVTS